MSLSAQIAKFCDRLIYSVLRASNLSVLKIEKKNVILRLFYATPFGYVLFPHYFGFTFHF